MAALAKSLIELESLKERVTKPSESVSGPIDVAVISKHDGFVWIDRKHYFRPELNPRFLNEQTDGAYYEHYRPNCAAATHFFGRSRCTQPAKSADISC